MKYSILPHSKYEKEEYCIVPIREQDMETIRKWRNEQMPVLRQQKTLTAHQQKLYWEMVLKPLFRKKLPNMILFSYLKDGVCIGYGGLVHIDWDAKRAEVSYLTAPDRIEDTDLYQGEFARFLVLLFQVARDLKLHRLHTETFDIRPKHVEVLEACGFQLEGLMKDHALVEDRYVDSLIHGIILED